MDAKTCIEEAYIVAVEHEAESLPVFIKNVETLTYTCDIREAQAFIGMHMAQSCCDFVLKEDDDIIAGSVVNLNDIRKQMLETMSGRMLNTL